MDGMLSLRFISLQDLGRFFMYYRILRVRTAIPTYIAYRLYDNDN